MFPFKILQNNYMDFRSLVLLDFTILWLKQKNTAMCKLYANYLLLYNLYTNFEYCCTILNYQL